MRTETRGDSRYGSNQDEIRYYNAYPTLEIKRNEPRFIKLQRSKN